MLADRSWQVFGANEAKELPVANPARCLPVSSGAVGSRTARDEQRALGDAARHQRHVRQHRAPALAQQERAVGAWHPP